MRESAVERARNRFEQRADAAALDTVLERTREDLARLAETAAETAAALPARVEDSLREQVLPVGRHIAEVRGLLNQVVRRLDVAERSSETDRHARVEDLGLLVDLIGAGWESVDERLTRLEETLTRVADALDDRAGATIYRLEHRRADAATS